MIQRYCSLPVLFKMRKGMTGSMFFLDLSKKQPKYNDITWHDPKIPNPCVFYCNVFYNLQ